MITKKEEARFTIKFNPVNPRHREAVRILNEAGRGKATLIAEALNVYSQITNAAHKVIDNKPGATPVGSDVMTLHPKTSDAHETTNATQSTEDDIWQTVHESLESFFNEAPTFLP